MDAQTCPSCKAANDGEARFCDQCGTRLALDKAVGGDEECPACGGRVAPVGGGGGDCGNCGLHVPAPEDEQPAAEPGPAPAPAPAVLVPCPLCGEQVRDDAASCPACGLWYESPRTPQPCPRCSQPAGPDDCGCGAILTLDKLVSFLEASVRFVCRKCKSPYARLPEGATKCPDCGGALLPAERLKAYARSLKG